MQVVQVLGYDFSYTPERFYVRYVAERLIMYLRWNLDGL